MQDALKGIRLLDLTMNLPGPFMTWLMAEMGAEILKVENPEGGDFARAFTDPEQDAYFPVFDAVNRGKKSITLDLKQGADRKRFLQLVGDYTIVVEGFRPGVMKKLGIDYDTVRRQYPEVIYVSISGYGQHGSYSQKGGHDLNYQALAGSFDTGSMTDAPSVPTVPVADLGGGSLFALSGLLAAIIQRNNTGKGQHLDVSLYDGAFALNVFAFCQMQRNMVQNRADGHFLSGNQPFYNIYETSDGRYMTLGAVEQKFWITFCKTAGREDLIPRQFGGKTMIQQVSEIFKSRTLAEWIELFRNTDACCEAVLSIREVIDSDLCRERNLTGTDDSGTFTLKSPIKSVGEPSRQAAEVPALGEHNAVLNCD
jgi:crotonobetainyl-CoA:carnitine CoA-transferase CaiB-like acyl-CoA transferase